MKQNSNSKTNPNPKSKTFWGSGGEGWGLGSALDGISSGTHLSASRALDSTARSHRRMTAGRSNLSFTIDQLFQALLPGHLHVVDIDTIARAIAVQIKLKRVGEFISSGEHGIVKDADR